MGYLVAKGFGGLNTRLAGHLLPANVAQDLSNVNLDAGTIAPLRGLGATVTSGSGTPRSAYKFEGAWNVSATAWVYAEYDGQLLRAAAGQTPQRSADGVTWRNLGITAPVVATVAVGAAGALTGDFNYVQVYRSALGGTSGPGVLSATLTLAAQRGDVGVTASADPQVNGIDLYRIGGGSTELKLVASLPNTTGTYTDNIAVANLGAALSAEAQLYATPPQFEGIIVTPWGAAIGWLGTSIYFTPAGQVQAWPASYALVAREAVVGMLPFQGEVVFWSAAAPYSLVGNDPTNYGIQATGAQQGLIARTAVDMGGFILYRSPDGVCRYQMGGLVDVISKEHLADATMAAMSTANNHAERYNERYLLFHPDSASPGFLEFDPRCPGSPWKKGTISGTASHYNRTDDTLYVVEAGGANVKAWEAGSNLTFSYRTADLTGKVASQTKHFRRAGFRHEGANTLATYVNGAAHGVSESSTTAALEKTMFPMAAAGWGERVSLLIGGTGVVAEALVHVDWESEAEGL